jgi:tryptophan synthase alpha chain
VGFGIRDAESAGRVGAIADAVVVGSALVSLIGRLGKDRPAMQEEVSKVLAGMRQALDSTSTEVASKLAAK